MNKPMVFFQGKDEVDLPLPIYDTGDNPRELIDNVFPALIPAEEQYDRMVTWEECYPVKVCKILKLVSIPYLER